MDGTLEIRREPTGVIDRWRHYKVLIDGEVVEEKLQRGDVKTFPLKPGPHQLQLRVMRTRHYSPAITVDVAPGSTVHYRCWPMPTPGAALYYIFFSPAEAWIGLDRISASGEPGQASEKARRAEMRTAREMGIGVLLGLMILPLGVSALLKHHLPIGLILVAGAVISLAWALSRLFALRALRSGGSPIAN